MRTFEILLSLLNAMALASLGVPRLRAIGMQRVFALVPALLAGVQVLTEGSRPQMIPAYALATVFSLVWLYSVAAAERIRVHHLVAALTIALGTLVLVVSVAAPIALPVFRFPKPTGPYAVGTVTYDWVDASRPELFAADPGACRELMAQIWYPAREDPSKPRVPYLEYAEPVTTALARIVHFPEFFVAHLKYATTNAISRAPVAGGTTAFPVLVFLSGLGGFRSSNTLQIEELVSHGYVVVGLDQPGASAAVRFPSGRVVSVPPRERIQALIAQSISPKRPAPILVDRVLANGVVPYFAQDVSFALDRLAALNRSESGGLLYARLDEGRIGVFGISLGAMVAAEAAHGDARIKAALMMDAAMPKDVVGDGLAQPCMWITRPATDMRLERSRTGGWAERDILETLSTMQAVFDRHRPGSAYYLDAYGTFHVNFTDAPLWSPFTSLLGITGPVDGRRMWDIVDAYSLAFFDEYLKGEPQPLLDRPTQRFPEALLRLRIGAPRPAVTGPRVEQ